MAIECLNDDRNVTYDSEGLWRCTARNTIKGHERVTHSQPIRVEVSGRPLPIPAPATKTGGEAAAQLGEDAEVSCDWLLNIKLVSDWSRWR